MPERFKVVCTMQGAIQVLGFTFFLATECQLSRFTYLRLFGLFFYLTS